MRVRINAHTNHFRLCKYRTQRSLRSRRRWKKHVDAIFAMCWRIESELSSRTPRFRTQSEGWIVACSMQMVTSVTARRCRLASVPNQIASVLLGFSCRRRRVHQSWTVDTQRSNLRQTSATPLGVVEASSWLSSAKKRGKTLKSVINSPRSSVYMTNCAGPRTEPCGTPYDRVLGVDCWLLMLTVWVRQTNVVIMVRNDKQSFA